MPCLAAGLGVDKKGEPEEALRPVEVVRRGLRAVDEDAQPGQALLLRHRPQDALEVRDLRRPQEDREMVPREDLS